MEYIEIKKEDLLGNYEFTISAGDSMPMTNLCKHDNCAVCCIDCWVGGGK